MHSKTNTKDPPCPIDYTIPYARRLWRPSPRDIWEQKLTNAILGDPEWTAWVDDLTPREYDAYIWYGMRLCGIYAPHPDKKKEWSRDHYVSKKGKGKANEHRNIP